MDYCNIVRYSNWRIEGLVEESSLIDLKHAWITAEKSLFVFAILQVSVVNDDRVFLLVVAETVCLFGGRQRRPCSYHHRPPPLLHLLTRVLLLVFRTILVFLLPARSPKRLSNRSSWFMISDLKNHPSPPPPLLSISLPFLPLEIWFKGNYNLSPFVLMIISLSIIICRVFDFDVIKS